MNETVRSGAIKSLEALLANLSANIKYSDPKDKKENSRALQESKRVAKDVLFTLGEVEDNLIAIENAMDFVSLHQEIFEKLKIYQSPEN